MADKQNTDATRMLETDHRKVEELFEKFEKASGHGGKEKLAHQICDELKIHSMLEEEIFYPALKGKIEEDMLNEAYVEHDGAKLLINEIMSGGPDEQFYDAKVKVLQEQIEHHVKEEEKQANSMFKQARKADVDLKALGEQMMTRKQELMKMAKSEGLPAAETTTM
jgi:hemerythrin superfamily protein